MMMKFGAPDLSTFQGNLPASLQSGSVIGLAKNVPNNTSQGLNQAANSQMLSAEETFASKVPSFNTLHESRTEKVINNFLQSPILKGDSGGESKELLLRDTVCFLI